MPHFDSVRLENLWAIRQFATTSPSVGDPGMRWDRVEALNEEAIFRNKYELLIILSINMLFNVFSMFFAKGNQSERGMLNT